MSPLPAPEPSQLLDTVATLAVRKLRMEIQHLRLPTGVEGNYGCIRHPGASLAVPVLADGRVVVLRQYRFAVQRRILNFQRAHWSPMNSPTGHGAELQEELATAPASGIPLVVVALPGYSDGVIHLFLARQLTPVPAPVAGDDDEDIEVVLMQPKELDAALASGDEALDGKSVTAWYRAKQLLGLG